MNQIVPDEARPIWCCTCQKDVQARLTDGREIYPHRHDLAALEEADFLASRLLQRQYILDAGNMRVKVDRSFGPDDVILEIVNPPELEVIEV